VINSWKSFWLLFSARIYSGNEHYYSSAARKIGMSILQSESPTSVVCIISVGSRRQGSG